MAAGDEPARTGIPPPVELLMPGRGEDADIWSSVCDRAQGSGLGRLALPGVILRQRSPDGCEEQFDLGQDCDYGSSNMVEDEWQDMSFIPVYCADMMVQLAATCSSTSCATELPGCNQTSGQRPATAVVGSSSSEIAAANFCSGVPECMLNLMPAPPVVTRWGVMDTADLPAHCTVSYCPDTPVVADDRTWASQFHSAWSFDQQQQLQEKSLSTLQQQFHTCVQQPEGQQATVLQLDIAAAAAATAGQCTQLARTKAQPVMACQDTATVTIASMRTPSQKEDVHLLPSLASVEGLDSLADLPLHNPYTKGASKPELCGLDAAMFMGEF